MIVELTDNSAVDTMSVFGGKEQYQNARREYLEFVFPQEGHTVEGLEAALATEHCGTITLTDETGAKYIHVGYIIRGPVRVFLDEDGAWKIGVKRYQQTDLERELDQLKETVAGLVAAQAGGA